MHNPNQPSSEQAEVAAWRQFYADPAGKSQRSADMRLILGTSPDYPTLTESEMAHDPAYTWETLRNNHLRRKLGRWLLGSVSGESDGEHNPHLAFMHELDGREFDEAAMAKWAGLPGPEQSFAVPSSDVLLPDGEQLAREVEAYLRHQNGTSSAAGQ